MAIPKEDLRAFLQDCTEQTERPDLAGRAAELLGKLEEKTASNEPEPQGPPGGQAH